MKKNKLLGLLALLVLPLSACSFLSLTLLNDEVKEVYSLLGDIKDGKDIQSYKTGIVSLKVKDGEDHLLYMTLASYGEMLRPHLKEGYFPYYTDDGTSSVWMVANPNGDYIFGAQINPRNKTVWSGGSLSDALTTGKDYSKSSLNVQMSISAETLREATKEGNSSYSGTSYKAYRRNNETYYPLSLLDASFASLTGVNHLYNYNRIIQFDDYDKLSEFKYVTENGQTVTPFSEMKAYINSNFSSMPSYLIYDRANAFFYIMENYYGLALTRNISSMLNYYKKQAYYDYFYSSDQSLRNEALYAAIGLLDDGHSAVREDETAPWYTKDYNYGGTHLNNMIQVRNFLSSYRSSFYSDNNKQVGDVLYSSNGRLAFFSFDSFNFEEEAYNGDNLKEDLYLTDTYFQFIKNFKDIKAHGGVNTVVIDISINGGGVLGIMMKLLALLSKDNKAPIYVMEDKTMIVEKDITSVDSNGDNQFDVRDCFGNDFNFAILTSGYSFSCGNAFPYFASKFNYAKIIGQTSAGGECTVEESMLPSGEHFFHSSTLHLGYFDERTRVWSGDESGAPVDQKIDYDNFYNLDYLQTIIQF